MDMLWLDLMTLAVNDSNFVAIQFSVMYYSVNTGHKYLAGKWDDGSGPPISICFSGICWCNAGRLSNIALRKSTNGGLFDHHAH